MNLDINEEDAWQVGFMLAQLLPIVEIDKKMNFWVLKTLKLMEKLDKMLSEMSGGKQ